MEESWPTPRTARCTSRGRRCRRGSNRRRSRACGWGRLGWTSRSHSEVAAVGGPGWFQLYVMEDRDHSAELVKRAHAAGYSALVLTVDFPVLGIRDRDERNSFSIPEGVELANLTVKQGSGGEGSDLFTYVLSEHDRSLTWDDLAWIRSLAPLPLVLKGIVTAEDTRLAVEAGVDGIVVSNHG